MEALAADKSDSSRRFRFVRYENNLNSGCRTQTVNCNLNLGAFWDFWGVSEQLGGPKKQFSGCKNEAP
jgi:hypothetical protein